MIDGATCLKIIPVRKGIVSKMIRSNKSVLTQCYVYYHSDTAHLTTLLNSLKVNCVEYLCCKQIGEGKINQ